MDKYEKYLDEVKKMIPKEEYERIMSQERCEYDRDFMGFLNVYKPLSEIIPEEITVIDFGCNLAAQSYFFSKHKKYIGVDVVDMERFTPSNAEHYVCTIQDFLDNELPKLCTNKTNLDFFAICSYVPDFRSTQIVREKFPNVFCYYPVE